MSHIKWSTDREKIEAKWKQYVQAQETHNLIIFKHLPSLPKLNLSLVLLDCLSYLCSKVTCCILICGRKKRDKLERLNSGRMSFPHHTDTYTLLQKTHKRSEADETFLPRLSSRLKESNHSFVEIYFKQRQLVPISLGVEILSTSGHL